jgi:hypothetical protein
MKIRFDLQRLKNNPETPWFVLDLAMVALVFINLTWIIFDWMFSSAWIASGIHYLSPQFHDFYATKVHTNFVAYDLIFVWIYLVELTLRWCVAIYKQTYHRWFFYPFVHWYDVLGCIPIGSFRFLRVLRVISILYRLQKLGIIDIKETYLYQQFQKYVGIITEEISDRVVINVLNGVQDEIRKGNPVTHAIQNDVLGPKSDELVTWLGSRLGHALDHAYEHNEEQVREYLQSLVHQSLARNSNIKRLNLVPIVGPQIQETMEGMSVELVEDVLITLMNDLADSRQQLAANIISNLIKAPAETEAQQLLPILQEAVLESLELIKDQVAQQQWKLAEQQAQPEPLRS